MKPDGFSVWDTEEKCWWTNRRGKRVWGRRADAANAWNIGKYRQPKFSEQSRYVTVPVRLIPMEALPV
jgi:hypothetical protein